ncbi:MAG TPA: DUF3048 domain-containing protein [Acidimicrobiia bacterium]|nr:DUF3048 domain-containing protein [Acidimicrobiia bacterium]
MRRSLMVAFALLAACSNSTVPNTTAMLTTTTTAAATTTSRVISTTTSAVVLPTSPINGMPVVDETLLDRRLLAVKIDNHANARPQSGLDAAAAVIELPVEGITRFIALFHDTDSTYLGPVRSGRPSDGKLLNPLGATFAISGGQSWVLQQIRNEGVSLISDSRPGMFRISGRRAPHNLYADTLQLREVADDREFPDDPPPPLFQFGPLPTTAAPATEVVMSFGGSFVVTWTWDPTSKTYVRSFGGSEAELMDQEGERYPLTAQTLVVMLAERYTERPPSGSGSAVPAMDTVGSGEAFVFAGGKMTSGSWARESSDDLIAFSNEDGSPLLVPPGFIWVSVVPVQSGIDVS